jgi:hypothetical protein
MWVSPVACCCNYGKYDVLVIETEIKSINYAQTGVDVVTHVTALPLRGFFPPARESAMSYFFPLPDGQSLCSGF